MAFAPNRLEICGSAAGAFWRLLFSGFLLTSWPMNSVQVRLLVGLGRVAILPTVWSNGLAGWWLGGGGNLWKLPFLLLGTGLLHTGGAFLNDAFDAEADQRQRPERPVPAGKISAALVWRLGFGQLALGIFLLLFCGQLAAGAAFFLALTILLFNFSHQFFTAAPVLLGICRFWLYIIGGATGAEGLTGFAIFGGAALAGYVAGAGLITGRKPNRAATPRWPVLLLSAPILLALAMNTDSFRIRAVWLSVVVLTWTAHSLRKLLFGGPLHPAHTAANLLAGICLVDWLAVGPSAPGTSLWLFGTGFALTKSFQKILPPA